MYPPIFLRIIHLYYYRVTIAYKGTDYFGWQAQSLDTSDEKCPTVEGTILNVLKKISNFQSCSISATSRTDGGVHAQGQIAKISIAKEISPEKLLKGLNTLLPFDIRILQCTSSTKDYQPNRSSISKEYHYYFETAPIGNAITSDIALHIPVHNNTQDTLILLQEACKLFIGRNDFYNFSSRDKNSLSTFREIIYCDIHQANFSPLVDNLYYLKIIGDGFLKHMIRYLMGALKELAYGNITLDDITLYLQQHQEHKLSPRVKSKGLHLINIEETE